jgi:hypothetical protein
MAHTIYKQDKLIKKHYGTTELSPTTDAHKNNAIVCLSAALAVYRAQLTGEARQAIQQYLTQAKQGKTQHWEDTQALKLATTIRRKFKKIIKRQG